MLASRLNLYRCLALAGVLAAGGCSAQAAGAPRHGMVATAQHEATRVGLAVLEAGGNAVDAAVAVGYALAVVDPCCGNVGGGGFMLVRFAGGKEAFVDFRERAPLLASPSIFLDASGRVRKDASTKSFLAVGVPGTVAGLEYARTHFGSMSRRRLMAPAIALAREGFVLDGGDAAELSAANEELSASPGARRIFTHDGTPRRAGERFVQPQLARTLDAIALSGPDAFYRGWIAREIVDASRGGGGLLSMRDFADYRVATAPPVHCRYRGYDITSAPPPSSGGTTLCEILNIASGFPIGRYGWNSAQTVHVLVEAERRAFADRNAYLADPAFVKNPVDRLLDSAYAAKLRAQIVANRATPSVDVRPGLGPPSEETQTTHYSIVDEYGNAVAVTYTINDSFGSDLVAGDTGFLLNDEMDDFTSKPGAPNMYGLVQGVRNEVEGGKRPLSSMTPTIVTRDGKLFMVTGSPGGPRIITTTLATIQNAIDFGMGAQAAVAAPRFHHQWLPDLVYVEPHAFTAATAQRLREMGYAIDDRFEEWGSAQTIVVDPRSGRLFGGSDPRSPAGAALGF